MMNWNTVAQRKKAGFLLGLIGILSIGIDQLTKFLVVEYLKPIHSVPLWKNVLHLTYVENRGAAFGMLADHRWIFMVVSTVGILAVCFYAVMLCQSDNWLLTALSLIVGGGIGNMIDRVALSYVVDFIDFTLINFAVFNVADSCVCVGAGILIVRFLQLEAKEAKKEKEKASENQSDDHSEDSSHVGD